MDAERSLAWLPRVALALHAVALACAAIVITVVRDRLDRPSPQYTGTLDLVNPPYMAGWLCVQVGLALLIVWVGIGFKRGRVRTTKTAGAAWLLLFFAIPAMVLALREYVRLG